MFGGKKTREAQEQRLEALQKEYIRLKDELKKTKGVSDETFAVLRVQDLQMEHGLEGMTSLLKATEQDAEGYDRQAARLAEELETLARAQESCERDAQRRERTLADTRAALERVQRLEKICREAEETERELSAACKELLGQSAEELVGLTDAAQNMSVLALNAAIEAGRMGEAGMDFLHAAENIRKQAEDYHRQLATVSQRLQRLQGIYEESKLLETLGQMKLAYQETGRQTELLDKTAAEPSEAEERSLCAQALREQKKAAEELAGGMRRTEERCQSAFGQMELIGQNYIEAKKAKEELEEHLSGVYGRLS